MRFALPLVALLAASPAFAQQAQPQGDPIDPNAYRGYYQNALAKAQDEAAQLAGAFAAEKAKLDVANKQVAELRKQVDDMTQKGASTPAPVAAPSGVKTP